MIIRPGPDLPVAEAARRAASGAEPIWLSSPGTGPGAETDKSIAWDVVAADPVSVVRGDSLEVLTEAWAAAQRAWAAEGDPPVPEVPAAVGWLSYDLPHAGVGRRMPVARVDRTRIDGDEGTWSGLEFRFFDAFWMKATGRAPARIFARDAAAADRLAARLSRPAPVLVPPRIGPLRAESSPAEARAAHRASVARIREYLLAGDVYQVNLARRLTATIDAGDPVWVAATLRARAPAPHAIWMGGRTRVDGPIDRAVVGNSPERFLALSTARWVETRPIKGTRARGADPCADARARASLLAAAKDRAEHVMIVDLERNDLGRVCQTGTVTVDGLLRVVELPTVFHLVSTVRGRLRAEIGLRALLEAMFPGGSITGAPKRRAMEVIAELEPAPRALYTGATGWLGAAGDLDLAVAIRTAVVSGGRLSLSVGGGIVADSDADAEWDETEVKARAFMNLCQSPGAA